MTKAKKKTAQVSKSKAAKGAKKSELGVKRKAKPVKKVASKAVKKTRSKSISESESRASKIAAKPSVLSKVDAPAKLSKKKSGTSPADSQDNALIRAKKQALKVAAEAAASTKRGKKKDSQENLLMGELGKVGKKWALLYKKSGDKKAPTYSMRGVYEAKSPILHKVLGWGYILTNKNDRLEVLFQDGVRYLISNYKA